MGSGTVWPSRPSVGGGRASGGRPRPLAASALSALVPGTGQLLAHRRLRGSVLLGITAVCAGLLGGVAWGVWTGSGPDLLGWLLSPRGLAALVVANVVLALFHLFATLDAWAAARQDGGQGGRLQVAGLVALVAAVMAPHAALGLAGAEARRVVDAVFVSPEESAEQAAATDSRDGEDGEGRGGGEDGGPNGHEDGGANEPDAPDQGPTPELAGSEEVRGPAVEQGQRPADTGLLAGRDRLTVLMLGSDAGPDRPGARIDALVVASIDIDTGEVALISVPRNFGDVPMGDGVVAERLGEVFPQRLMSLYPAAEADEVLAAHYADPGKEAHVVAVEALLGVGIDHVAMIDLGGFVDVIDAFGGVEVEVSDPMHVRMSPPRPGEDWRTYDIPAGAQRLDGHEAHAFVRSRTGSDDYDRMRRQRCLIGSLVDDIETVSLLRALPSLADVLVERVHTDIGTDSLPELARLAGRVDVGSMRTLGLTPPAYTDGRTANDFFAPDLPVIRQAVADLLAGGEATSAGVADLDGTCG